MIERAAEGLAFYFCQRRVYPEAHIPEYSYGFQLLLSTVINAACVIAVSLVLQVFRHTLFFILAFASLRATLGGYHAKSHRSCILLVNIVYAPLALLMTKLPDGALAPYSLLCAIFTSLVVWMHSPVEARNKPLQEGQRRRLRGQSMAAASLLLFAALAANVSPAPLWGRPIAFGLSGALAASASAYVEVKVQKKGEDQHEKADGHNPMGR